MRITLRVTRPFQTSGRVAGTVRVTKIRILERKPKKVYINGFLISTATCMYVDIYVCASYFKHHGWCVFTDFGKARTKIRVTKYSINREPAANRGIKIQLEISVTCEWFPLEAAARKLDSVKNCALPHISASWLLRNRKHKMFTEQFTKYIFTKQPQFDILSCTVTDDLWYRDCLLTRSIPWLHLHGCPSVVSPFLRWHVIVLLPCLRNHHHRSLQIRKNQLN